LLKIGIHDNDGIQGNNKIYCLRNRQTKLNVQIRMLGEALKLILGFILTDLVRVREFSASEKPKIIDFSLNG
jgi:hypothetical protein